MFILGILLRSYVIFNRLIRERIPHELTFQTDIVQKLITTLILILSVVIVILNIRKLFGIPIVYTEYNNKLANFFSNLFKVVEESLNKTTEIFLLSNKSKNLVKKLETLFCPLSDSTFWLYLFTIIIPRAIVAVTFFFDVCIFNYMHTFYLILPILLIPFLMNIIVHIFEFCGNSMQKEVFAVFKIDVDNTNGYKFTFHFLNEKEADYEDLEAYQKMYIFSLCILTFQGNFEDNKDKPFIICCKIIYRLLYIISWSYILIKSLHYF